MVFSRQTRPLSADEFLITVDDLHRRENQGGAVFDTAMGDPHTNILGCFIKAFRLKCGSIRNNYSSPFRVFELPLRSVSSTRFSSLTVHLGYVRNIQRGRISRTYDNLKILFDYLGFDDHYNHFDFIANTRKLNYALRYYTHLI